MFSRLIGNEAVKQALRRLISHERVPNSLLLAGPDGVGKLQFALEVVRAALCLRPVDGEGCGECASCKRAVRFAFPTSDKKEDYERVFFGDHPDVGIVIPSKRNILVNAIRHLEREAAFAPFEGSSRFFIVDDADCMNDASSNALLKTLEEPAPTSHVFLLTSRPDSLLTTIVSRCQTLRFAPIATIEIERYLIAEHRFLSEEATLAARLARGSVGRAISINVQEFRERRDRMFGVVRDAVTTGDLARLLRASEAMNEAKNRDIFEEYLEILETLIHDTWTLRTDGSETRIVNADLAAELHQLAVESTKADLPAWLSSIETLRQNLVVNINRKVATDALFVSMAA